MNITINGNLEVFNQSITINELLVLKNQNPKAIVVEKNLEIIESIFFIRVNK